MKGNSQKPYRRRGKAFQVKWIKQPNATDKPLSKEEKLDLSFIENKCLMRGEEKFSPDHTE